MFWCQVIIIVLQLLHFLHDTHLCFNGRSAQPPTEFPGFVGTLFAHSLILYVYYYAGAFSTVLGGP